MAFLLVLLAIALVLIVDVSYTRLIFKDDIEWLLFGLTFFTLVIGAAYLNYVLFWLLGPVFLAAMLLIIHGHRRQTAGKELRLTPGQLLTVTGAILAGMLLASTSGAYATLLWVSIALIPLFLIILIIYAVNAWYPPGYVSVVEMEKQLREDRRAMQRITRETIAAMEKRSRVEEQTTRAFLRDLQTKHKKGANL